MNRMNKYSSRMLQSPLDMRFAIVTLTLNVLALF
jgi:hypothetical protein